MPGLAAVKAAAAVAAGARVDVQYAVVRKDKFIGAVFEVASRNGGAVPAAGEHALAVLAVGDAMAVDQQAHGFFLSGAVGVDVENQFGAFDLGRGNVKYNLGAFVFAKSFADIALDAHFVGQVQGGGKGGLSAGLGVDETVAGVAAEIIDDNAFHALAPRWGI